jgi:hypothetical protein
LNALLVLNGPKSPFFTIGCEKACNKGDVGHWMKGYLEFSFNSIQLVADAQNYFALFYKFNECIQEREKQNTSTDPVEYHFDLEAAQFLATSTVGFTLTVWITTSFFPEEEGAKRAWGEAVDILVNYLKTLQIGPSAPIYSS